MSAEPKNATKELYAMPVHEVIAILRSSSDDRSATAVAAAIAAPGAAVSSPNGRRSPTSSSSPPPVRDGVAASQRRVARLCARMETGPARPIPRAPHTTHLTSLLC